MIYLDHAAATPVSSDVLQAMEPYFLQDFFNPSAAYLPAKKVAADYEKAKAEIAHAIGAKASDLVITAGATEANNLAFTVLDTKLSQMNSACDSQRAGKIPQSLAGAAPELPVPYSPRESSRDLLGLAQCSQNSSAIALYLVTEHDSVRRIAEAYGGEAVMVLPNGLIDLNDLRSKITDDTELISVALVNNELGTIQPLAEIAQIIREVKIDRMKRGIKRQLLLHSDASQALTLLDINVARLGVDLLTLNAAKVYGPKGVGALYASHGARLHPIAMGGGQENGLRPGTENVPGVIGFAEATKNAKKHLGTNRKKCVNWKRILLDELQGYELINKKHTLDNFLVLCYNGIDAERLIYLLEEKEVYLATGAACAASKGVRSHVLKAIGLSDEQIAGSLRLSFGETNDEEQIREAARIINEVVAREREWLADEK